MRNAIPFKAKGGTNWLMPGSQAHKLATEGKTKELATHMKDVDARHEALVGEPPMLPLLQKISEGGFKRGELMVIAAARDPGKSTFNAEMGRRLQEKRGA